MIKGLLRGETPEQVLQYASKRLKATGEELLDALSGELTQEHVFVISEILSHIEDLERRIAVFFRQLLTKLEPYKPVLQAMQTIPGLGGPQPLDRIWEEISSDFGSSKI
uniref:Uncharacterized protein n=1 Tax=Candidatus Kentrum sp. LFY TaxID=2126342 RepID=A0A450WJP6_9GAMM|nr:MAG: hypothetical protein BECKLFY1418C_GA0070996_10301 [Candidatus Kentron sp. LFY]